MKPAHRDSTFSCAFIKRSKLAPVQSVVLIATCLVCSSKTLFRHLQHCFKGLFSFRVMAMQNKFHGLEFIKFQRCFHLVLDYTMWRYLKKKQKTKTKKYFDQSVYYISTAKKNEFVLSLQFPDWCSKYLSWGRVHTMLVFPEGQKTVKYWGRVIYVQDNYVTLHFNERWEDVKMGILKKSPLGLEIHYLISVSTILFTDTSSLERCLMSCSQTTLGIWLIREKQWNAQVDWEMCCSRCYPSTVLRKSQFPTSGQACKCILFFNLRTESHTTELWEELSEQTW